MPSLILHWRVERQFSSTFHGFMWWIPWWRRLFRPLEPNLLEIWCDSHTMWHVSSGLLIRQLVSFRMISCFWWLANLEAQKHVANWSKVKMTWCGIVFWMQLIICGSISPMNVDTLVDAVLLTIIFWILLMIWESNCVTDDNNGWLLLVSWKMTSLGVGSSRRLLSMNVQRS